MDCIVHGVAKSWTRLSDFHFHRHIQYMYVLSHFSYVRFFATPWVLLQGIFPTQGLNPCLLHLLHCRWIFVHWATWEAHIKYTWHICHYFYFHSCSRLHESFTEQSSQKLSQHSVTEYTIGLNGKTFSSSVTAEIFMNILPCSYIVLKSTGLPSFCYMNIHTKKG